MISFLLFLFLQFSRIEACFPTIPPEEYYPTATLPTTTMINTCECNDLPPGVTQEFLDTRIKDKIDKVILPETWEPGVVSCGLGVGCLFDTPDSSIESREYFLVTAATDGGEDPITLFEDARLFCTDGTWTNNGQKIIAVGCYAILK